MNSLDFPMISVVMPNYNGKRFVAKTIRSVLNQTYKDFELIIVDDCSSDNSVEIIRGFCEEDSRVCLITNEKNEGVSFARNMGIQKARGKYIALIDNDDTWEYDKLERQVALAETGAEIVYCSYDFINENGTSIKRPFIVPEKATFHSMLTSSVISCSTVFIRADLLKQHPFNSSYYHEDYVLWMELLSLPIRAVGDTKVLMHYRQVSGSRSSKKGNAARERWNTYRKALKLSIPKSILVFIGYSINGVIKYYF